MLLSIHTVVHTTNLTRKENMLFFIICVIAAFIILGMGWVHADVRAVPLNKTSYPYVAIGVALGGLLTLMLGCAPPVPHWEFHCVRSHEESTVDYGVGGVPIGGQTFGTPGMQIHNETVCDQHDSTWVVPDTTRRR